MSSTEPASLDGVIMYADREKGGPTTDPGTNPTTVSFRTRREARRQEKRRLKAARKREQAVRNEAVTKENAERAEAHRVREEQTCIVRSLKAEVFELVTQQDAWDCTFKGNFGKMKFAYRLTKPNERRHFVLGTDEYVWSNVTGTLSPLREFNVLNDSWLQELRRLLESARDHLKVR